MMLELEQSRSRLACLRAFLAQDPHTRNLLAEIADFNLALRYLGEVGSGDRKLAGKLLKARAHDGGLRSRRFTGSHRF